MKRAIVVDLERLCGRLDQIPFPELVDGKIRFYKGLKLDDRWGTGVWK